MNRSDLIAEIAERQNLPATTVEEVLDAFTSLTLETLQQGEQVAIRSFGKFVPRVRKAVTRMNPRTQEPISVPETRSVGFVPSLKLKERLNSGD
jgi:DNA-binding protein HU-beta